MWTHYATLTGVSADWDSIKLVNDKVQRPLLQELAQQADDSTETRSLGLSGVKTQALIDANQAVISGSQTPEEATAAIQQVFDANPDE